MTKTQQSAQDTDVFAVWRQLYDANEKAWTTALEDAMGTTEFSESSGRLLETMLAAQKSVRENMRAYLETVNVPTREDIARLGELIVGLEEKSDQIADRLDVLDTDLGARSGDSARLDRMSTGLAAIERALKGRPAEVAKLDRMAKRLEAIERAVGSRATAGKPAARPARAATAKTTPAKATATKPPKRAAKTATTSTGPVA
jgi:polyhydroxyalkanoic acid synthase PhaR subunit